ARLDQTGSLAVAADDPPPTVQDEHRVGELPEGLQLQRGANRRPCAGRQLLHSPNRVRHKIGITSIPAWFPSEPRGLCQQQTGTFLESHSQDWHHNWNQRSHHYILSSVKCQGRLPILDSDMGSECA